MLYILIKACYGFLVIVQMLMILEETSIIPPNSWSRTFSFLPPTSLVSALPNVNCLTLDISSVLVTSVVTFLDVNCHGHFGIMDNGADIKLEHGTICCSWILFST